MTRGSTSKNPSKNRGIRSEANLSAAKGEWKPFASFVVEFQARRVKGQTAEQRTTVHYMEADKSETWSGVEAGHSLQWMLDQLGERLQQAPSKESPSTARLIEGPPMTVRITDIQAFQPPQIDKPIGVGHAGRPFPGFLKSREPFALEVSFGLAGLPAADVTQGQLVYSAQFHALRLGTRAPIHLGNTEPNTVLEGKLNYNAMLSEATLPPGLYRLRTLVTLRGAPAVPGYLEVPMLQVV